MPSNKIDNSAYGTKIKDYLGIDVSKNMIERAKLEYPGYKFLHYDGKFLRVKKKLISHFLLELWNIAIIRRV